MRKLTLYGTSEMCTALFTDLYELTMAQAYHYYIVAAGFDDVARFLNEFHFTTSDVDYLHTRQEFSGEFLEWLRDLRFSGEVYAVPEGTIVFPNEPLLQVIAPIIEAQLIETFVLNQIHFQSLGK